MEKLEEVSYLVKFNGQNGIKIDQFLKIEDIHNYQNYCEGIKNYVDAMSVYFKVWKYIVYSNF